MTPFRSMLRLRPVEWVPILVSILINVSTGLYAWHSATTAMDAPETFIYLEGNPSTVTSAKIPEGPFQLFEAGKIVTAGLLLFGASCWFWRLNRWIKERT